MANMKKTLILILSVLLLSLFVFSELKIGVINPQKVIENTVRGKQIIAKFNTLRQSKQVTIQKMNNEIGKLEKELTNPALNTETRELKVRQLEDRKLKRKRFVEDAQKEFQSKYRGETQQLYKEIMPIIEEIGKAKGFSIILDLSTAGIAYYNKTIDVTNEVVAAYNKKFSNK